MSGLFSIIEKHTNAILKTHRANVLFYDHKRCELFHRNLDNTIDCNLFV